MTQAGQYIDYALQHIESPTDYAALEGERALVIVNTDYEIVLITEAAQMLLDLFKIHYEFVDSIYRLPNSCLNLVKELKYGYKLPQTMITVP